MLSLHLPAANVRGPNVSAQMEKNLLRPKVGISNVNKFGRRTAGVKLAPVFSMAQLVVSTESLLILSSDKGIFDLLGYHSQEMSFRSVLTLTGPRSDQQMFQSAIRAMQGMKIQFILYDAIGIDRRLLVSFFSYKDSGSNVHCLIFLCPSEAIMLKDVFADCQFGRALVSAETPHAIHMANKAFLDRFSCSTSEVLGLPLRLICRDYDSNLACSDHSLKPDGSESEDSLSALICIALDGSIARMALKTSDSVGNISDEVTCTPIVEAPNGRIRHLLITIGPLLCRSSTDELRTDDHPLYNVGRAKRRARPQVQPAATIDTSGFLVCPHLQSAGPAVFPRRKPRTESSRESIGDALAPPVVVTPELVAALAELPLRQAAAAAGLSPTAFKKACRKLGVRRWAYKRGRSINILTACSNVSGTHQSQLCTEEELDNRQPAPGPDLQPRVGGSFTYASPGMSAGLAAANLLWVAESDDCAVCDAWRSESARLDGHCSAGVEFRHEQDPAAFRSEGSVVVADHGFQVGSAALEDPWARDQAAAERLVSPGLEAIGSSYYAECGDRPRTPAAAGGLCTGVSAACNLFWEAPVVEECPVRDMLDMPWPLQV